MKNDPAKFRFTTRKEQGANVMFEENKFHLKPGRIQLILWNNTPDTRI